VRNHDHLALSLRFDKQPDQFVEHRFRIEVLFGLVDDQRAVVGVVEREIEQQQDDAPSSR